MRTSDAVTSAGSLPLAYGMLVLVYIALGAAIVWLLRRTACQSLGNDAPDERPAPAT
jgi:cytochrome bd-type quinol oxidase subunit 1